jgi:aldose 1-epimerase
MSGAAAHADRYATVALRDERSSLQARFVPALGMLCCSLRHRGQELLAQNAGLAAYAKRGKTMGIPLLYPWANRLSGSDYTVAGRAVQVPDDPDRIGRDGNGLPIHGVIGGRIAWELTQAPRDGGPLTARLSWDETRPELFEVFPFRHDLEYEARLAEGRLEVAVTLHACRQDAVPVAFGFHPYLSLPHTPRAQWLVDLPAMRPLALDDRQIPLGPAGERLSARSLQLADNAFDDGFDEVREPARFAVADGARRLSLEFIEGYSCAQIYAPPGRELICFEPMTAPANALRSGNGLHLLCPGERYRARFAVGVEGDIAGRSASERRPATAPR